MPLHDSGPYCFLGIMPHISLSFPSKWAVILNDGEYINWFLPQSLTLNFLSAWDEYS